MSKYVIFTDSCSDLSTELRNKYKIEYVQMHIVVDGKEMPADLDWKMYSPEEFYGWMLEGKTIKTTQVPFEEFVEKFTPYLQQGYDIIYIGCSSALTGSLNVMNLVKTELVEKYPDNKIIGIDSLTSCAGLAMLCIGAAQKRDEGLSFDELIKWVEDHKLGINQFATVETLTYLKNAGRVKASKAILGNLFHKKPVFISDAHGNNYTLGTVPGTKAADLELVKGTSQRIHKDECKYVFVFQGTAKDRATKIKEKLETELGVTVIEGWIGPIIGTSCGPGVIGVYCYGDKVNCYDGDGKKVSLDYKTL